MGKLCFQSLGSGSSGNCYYLGDKSNGILIDAGIGVRNIRKYLRNNGLDFVNILGVFITHDHADHIRAVGSLGEKHNIPVYTTAEIHEGISNSYCVTEKLYGSRRYIQKHETVKIGEFSVTAFPVSHDATDNVGYSVEFNEKKFTFATDLGYVCENAKMHLKQSHFMVFEANYDEYMLQNGSYPKHLQERIISDTGHLSNDQCGLFLAEFYNPEMEYIFLCHLSRENNRPEVAFETVRNYLEDKGVKIGEDVHLIVLDRYIPSKFYEFE